MTTRTGESEPATPLAVREDIVIADPPSFVSWYLDHVRRGPAYYRRGGAIRGGAARLEFGDLAWAVLLEGRPSSMAAAGLLAMAPIDIGEVPNDPLHRLDDDGIEAIVSVVCTLTRVPGIASAVATKMLHPLRPATIPVLDNAAIYGSYLLPGFRPGAKPKSRVVKDAATVREALTAIREATAAPEAEQAWMILEQAHAGFTRVELFDMAWWTLIYAQVGKAERGWRLKGDG